MALSTLTHLFINTRLYPDTTATLNTLRTMRLISSASSILAPLAKACPLLQRLHMDGDIGLEALSAFGATCPHVNYIFLSAPSIPRPILYHLHNLFPKLATLEVKEFNAALDDAGHEAVVESYCSDVAHALSSCAHLASLHLASLHVTHASTWDYLPPSLRELTVGSLDAAPAAATTLPALEGLRCWRAHSLNAPLPLAMLSRILRAAPNLRTLRGGVETLCQEGDMGSVLALHERGGLRTGDRGALELRIRGGEIATFFLPFPALSLFTSVYVLTRCTANGLVELVRVFPNLLGLTFIDTGFTDDMASRLVGLGSLRALEITDCKGLTDVGALAITRLPSLRYMTLSRCGLSGAEVLQAQARPGLVVEVVMYEPTSVPTHAEAVPDV